METADRSTDAQRQRQTDEGAGATVSEPHRMPPLTSYARRETRIALARIRGT